MRKRWGLALATFAAIVLGAMMMQPDPGQSVSTSSRISQDQTLLHLHESDMPIASGATAQAPAVPVETERVMYGTMNDRPVTGFLARPAEISGDLPALIVIHEWWGLNENIEAMTERLAGEGYLALAVDLYGSDAAETPDRARQLVETAANSRAAVEDNLRQAYDYLQGQNATAIASIGWCFGGSWSLNTALLLPDELDAAVIYYGGDLVLDPEQLDTLEMPILGIFGGLDQNPSVETVRAFASVLTNLEKSVEIHIYEGANHAFANPSGTRYNAEAAEDAWERTIAFLTEHLK